MRSLARQGDYCSGHGCFPPRANIEGSKNVYINSRGCHRKNDKWNIHNCRDSAHDAYTAEGSSTVYANSINVARICDPLSCGSAIAQGSPNVFCGG